MARIAVLEFGQSPESTPEHYISKPLAKVFRAYYQNGKKAVRELHDGLLQIVIDVTFGKLKELLKSYAKRTYVPMISPPRKPDWFFTNYPIRDDRTCEL